MVLPGARTDPRTPGGMPDSGTVNPGGPMPSMPKMGPGPGPTAPGAPDPARIEEIFTQYTSGQITREDLINQLHSFSEGEGGILGLLEGMEQQPEQPGQPGVQPGSDPVGSPGSIPPQPQPQPANVQNGQAISPGAASVPIPPLEEPLDARHQQISMMLQGYGLGPADADQMASILNPHEVGHNRTWSDDEGLWIDEYTSTTGSALTKQAAKDKTAAALASSSGGIAWDPTLSGQSWNYAEGKSKVADTGSGMQEMRAQAGLGVDAGSTASGIVERLVDGKKTLVEIGDTSGLTEYDRNRARVLQLQGNLGQGAFKEKAWSSDAFDQYSQKEGWKKDLDADVGEEDPWETVRTNVTRPGVALENEEVGAVPQITPDAAELARQAALDKQRLAAEAAKNLEGGQFASHPGFQQFSKYGAEPTAVHGWSTQGGTGSEVIFAVLNEQGKHQRRSSGKGGQTGGYMYMDANGNTFEGFEGPDGAIFKSSEDLDNFTDWQEQYSYWNNEPMDFLGFNNGNPVGNWQHMTQFGGEMYYFKTAEDVERFALHRQWPNGTFVKGFENGWPLYAGSNTAKPSGELIPKGSQPIHTFGANGMPGGMELDSMGLPIPGSGYNPDAPVDGSPTGGGFKFDSDQPDHFAGMDTGDPAGAGGGVPGAQGVGGTAPAVDPVQLAQARSEFPMLDEFLSQLNREDVNPASNPEITKSLMDVIGTLESLKLKGDQAENMAFVESIYSSTREALDRKAVQSRANLDRAFQEGSAIGVVANQATLASQAEENKRVFDLSQTAGYIPTLDANGNWVIDEAKSVGTLEREALDVSEADKMRSREIDIMSLFGTYIAPETETDKTIQTLEAQKFGFTKAMQMAEVTGKIPTEWTGDAQLTGDSANTFAMKRAIWEKDISNRNLDVQDRLALNAQQTQSTNLTIANNRNFLERHIADGNLAEAVNARKDGTWLEAERIKLERDKMKLDTLKSLSDPAAFLFAKRYGILDDIGDVLGISWGDDVPDEIPLMLQPGSIPTMREFQLATPIERQIMLAELASSGGYTTEEAVRVISEGAPGGGRTLRRPSLLGASR
jgi:hypothetical protein